MPESRTAEKRALLVQQCDFWLEGADPAEVTYPSSFYGLMRVIKRDATEAKDADALEKVTARWVALTEEVSSEQRKGYERRSYAADDAVVYVLQTVLLSI